MTDSGSSSASPAASLALYAGAHAAVDAVCAVMLWRAVHDGLIAATAAWSAFLVYNLLAFALQPVIGLAVDRVGRPRDAAVVGGLVTAAALPLASVPHLLTVAVVVAGLGNALFHVGGGVVSAAAAPGRASTLGYFVAPGAAGLALGIVCGRAGASAWPFAATLVLLVALIAARPAPVLRPGRSGHAPPQPTRVEAVVLCLLFVVGVRSYAGMALAMPWKAQMPLLVALTAAVVLGKALGGVLADRFGWRTVGVGALVVSLPLLALAGGSPAAGIAGMLVFNMTMPVTLAAVIAALPRHTGFAFGLTCLALFAGAAPVLAGWSPPLSGTLLVALTATAALMLWIGLGGLRREHVASDRTMPATALERGVT